MPSDIYGSSLTRGIASHRFDKAVRKELVTGIPNDQTGADTAIRSLLPGREYHQSIVTLPLGFAMATRYGPNKMWVDLHYRRGRTSLPTQPEQNVASFRGYTEHTMVYRRSETFLNGLPDGNPYFDPEQEAEPNGRPWRRPAVKMYVSMVLYYNAVPVVLNNQNALGKINPISYFIAGYDFPEFTLRLDSVDTDWFEVFDSLGRSRPGFITDYVFSVAPYGWYEHQLFGESGNWDVETNLKYETWKSSLRFPWQWHYDDASGGPL